MSSESNAGPYVTAVTDSGLLIIRSSPVTLSWVPRDTVNDAYNVGGTVTVGTFDSVEAAKNAASQQYPVAAEDWRVSDVLPFDIDAETRTEIHTPEIDGHNIVRHGIRWK
ncbi:MAG TPA: hypothetical protein VH351_01575 [Bryobacteraceae bacterium]|jgi:hypothetical protein|nr:hypothetical protein [Bryobacteraceae bacterium]